MRILALHTTTRACHVALADGEHLLTREGAQASTALPLLVREILNARELALDRLDLIAVAVGPGSFTGIKIGVACAWGLAVGARVRLSGVGSLDALARAAATPGTVLAIAQAYGPWAYAARFQAGSDLAPRLEGEYRVVKLEELAGLARGATVVAAQGIADLDHLLEPAARRVLVQPTGGALAEAVARLALRQAADGLIAPAHPLYLRAESGKEW